MISTWKDGSIRKVGIGRLTVWGVHMSLDSLFSLRFWIPRFHHDIRGAVMRGNWGPLAFNLHHKEIS